MAKGVMRAARGLGAWVVVALGLSGLCHVAGAASDCAALGYDNNPAAKAYKLYLYFPAADDMTFPEFGDGVLMTRPARAFDIGLLPSYGGSEADLRQAVTDVVSDIYCEFNVQVLQTMAPVTGGPMPRNVVAIGSDVGVNAFGNLQFGQAITDSNNESALDHGRVWAGVYQTGAGGTGGELSGQKSTLQRWAYAIGGSAAHEAGHGWGLNHIDGLKQRPGEDAQTHHLMADGQYYGYADRTQRRHFSDTDYERLAGAVGLTVQTMFDWSLTNPNQGEARALKLVVLSLQPTLTLGPTYLGPQSPWDAPTVIASGQWGLDNVVYYKHVVLWDKKRNWNGGPAGGVPGGGRFVVGTSVVATGTGAPDPLIVIDATLYDAEQRALPLHPRIPGFDAGSFDPRDGSFVVVVHNPGDTPLKMDSGITYLLPRQVAIGSALDGAPTFEPFRIAPVIPRSVRPLTDKPATLAPRDRLRLRVATLAEGQPVLRIVRGPEDCEGTQVLVPRQAMAICRPGAIAGLFPATSVLLKVGFTEPKARQWDRRRERYVNGPLRTEVRYQLAGQHPDLDGNGIDDFIDIAVGGAEDKNRDGVPDRAQRAFGR